MSANKEFIGIYKENFDIKLIEKDLKRKKIQSMMVELSAKCDVLTLSNLWMMRPVDYAKDISKKFNLPIIYYYMSDEAWGFSFYLGGEKKSFLQVDINEENPVDFYFDFALLKTFAHDIEALKTLIDKTKTLTTMNDQITDDYMGQCFQLTEIFLKAFGYDVMDEKLMTMAGIKDKKVLKKSGIRVIYTPKVRDVKSIVLRIMQEPLEALGYKTMIRDKGVVDGIEFYQINEGVWVGIGIWLNSGNEFIINIPDYKLNNEANEMMKFSIPFKTAKSDKDLETVYTELKDQFIEKIHPMILGSWLKPIHLEDVFHKVINDVMIENGYTLNDAFQKDEHYYRWDYSLKDRTIHFKITKEGNRITCEIQEGDVTKKINQYLPEMPSFKNYYINYQVPKNIEPNFGRPIRSDEDLTVILRSYLEYLEMRGYIKVYPFG